MKKSTLERKFLRLPFCARALALVTTALAIWVAQLPAWANSTPFSRIIVFGDSMSDTGSFYYMSGETYPPSPPYWEGRFCNGPVWVEYLAGDLGMAGLLDDYAVGGAAAGHDNSIVPAFGGVQDQMALYFASSPHADRDALYILWAGHNEVFIALPPSADPGPLNAFVDNTINNIKALWAAGARHILVVNIADLGTIPAISDPAARAFITGLVATYNERLADALKALAANGIPSIAFDEFTIQDYIVAHPAQFGLSNVTDPGMSLYPGEPTGYLYWDTVHPTTQGQHVIEQFAVRSLIEYFSPARGKGTPPAQVNALNGLVHAGKGR